MKKSHLVFLPCPGMGHIVSVVQFAKLLINHQHHLSVTMLIMRAPFDPNVDAYTHSLTSPVPFPDLLHLTLLPPYPDATNSQSLHPSTFLDSFIEYQKPSVRDAVSKLNSDLDSPRLAGFVADIFCTAMIDVATEFGIPPIVFYASGAAFPGLLLHIHTTREREEVDTTAFNFKDSGTEFDIPSCENPVPASVFPGVIQDKEWSLCFLEQASRIKKAKGVIVNTFEELAQKSDHVMECGLAINLLHWFYSCASEMAVISMRRMK